MYALFKNLFLRKQPQAEAALVPQLPPELLEKVFGFLREEDIERACRVCRLWNGVAASMTTHFALFLREKLQGDPYAVQRFQLSRISSENSGYHAIKRQVVEVLTGLGDEVLSDLVTASAAKAKFIFMLVNVVQIKKRITAANQIVHGQPKFEALFKVCKQLRSIGELEGAKKFINEAIVVADEIADRDHKSLALSQIASELRKVGELQRADRLFEKAVRVSCFEPLEWD